mmetsp:Transcript_3577/g.9473  ORF Transcript_3577/g.9473 Transcript_3577/m.9473 type:complete len:271 (-) Transcript_3577:1104-1916(-)
MPSIPSSAWWRASFALHPPRCKATHARNRPNQTWSTTSLNTSNPTSALTNAPSRMKASRSHRTTSAATTRWSPTNPCATRSPIRKASCWGDRRLSRRASSRSVRGAMSSITSLRMSSPWSVATIPPSVAKRKISSGRWATIRARGSRRFQPILTVAERRHQQKSMWTGRWMCRCATSIATLPHSVMATPPPARRMITRSKMRSVFSSAREASTECEIMNRPHLHYIYHIIYTYNQYLDLVERDSHDSVETNQSNNRNWRETNGNLEPTGR